MGLLGLNQAELPYCEYAKQGHDKRQQEVLVLTDKKGLGIVCKNHYIPM